MLTIRNKKGKKSALFCLAWTAPGIGAAAVIALLYYITYFATDVLGLNSGLVGMLLLVSKVFDGFTDIIAGFLIDKTHTKLGKARPYDIACTFFCLCAMLFFFIPDIGATGKAVLLFLIYLLTYSIFQTLYTCAGTVYMARAIESTDDQISLSSIGGMIGAIVSVVLSIAFPTIIEWAGTEQDKWKLVALAICIPSMLLTLVRIFLIPEIKDVQEEKKQDNLGVAQSAKLLFSNNYLMFFTLALLLTNIAQTLVSNSQLYYFKYVIGDIPAMTIVSAVAIIGPLTIGFFPALSKKFGMRNLMAVALFLGAIGRFLPVFQTTSMPMLIIGAMLNSFASMPIYILCANAIICCMDYGEYKSGIRGEGIYTCVSGFCSKVGIGLASGILGLVTAMGGYDGTLAVQSSSANMSIILCYTVIPTILYVIAGLALGRFNIEKQLPEIQKALKERNK